MKTVIRYAWPEVNDSYVCASPSHNGGIWQNGTLGRTNAIRFDDEATAKQFLAKHGFDLNPLRVTFETGFDLT